MQWNPAPLLQPYQPTTATQSTIQPAPFVSPAYEFIAALNKRKTQREIRSIANNVAQWKHTRLRNIETMTDPTTGTTNTYWCVWEIYNGSSNWHIIKAYPTASLRGIAPIALPLWGALSALLIPGTLIALALCGMSPTPLIVTIMSVIVTIIAALTAVSEAHSYLQHPRTVPQYTRAWDYLDAQVMRKQKELWNLP